MKKLLLTIISTLFVACGAFAQAQGETTEGQACGENATYVLADDGTLTISGTGALTDAFFSGNTKIKKVVVNEGITTISTDAFSFCTALESVSLPASVETIMDFAFTGCFALSEITLSEGLKTIGSALQITSLTSVTIPASVTSISNVAFQGNDKLTSIKVAEGSTVYKSVDGVLFTIDGTELLAYPGGKAGEYAVAEGVKVLGYCSFSDCDLVTKVSIPASVQLVENLVFWGCTGIKSIEVAEANTRYASVDGVLFNKAMSELLVCPGGKTGSYAVPDGVTFIWDNAFTNCVGMTSLIIPSSVTKIGYNIVETTAGKMKIEQIISLNPEPPTTAESFVEGMIDYETVPLYVPAASVEDYKAAEGWKMFANIIGLGAGTSGKCGDDATYALADDGTLTISGTGTLWDGVFADKADVSTVVIGEGITGFKTTFAGNTAITSITLPKSLENLDNLKAFDGCKKLTAINVTEGNAKFSSVDGVLFDAGGTTLVRLPEGISGEYKVSEGVTEIADGAFENCSLITGLPLPESLTTIGADVLVGCIAITSLDIPAAVDVIDDNDLSSCAALTAINVAAGNEVFASADGVLYDKDMTALIVCPAAKTGDFVVPDGIVAIQNNAFGNCVKLTSVKIPAGVETIGDKAFNGCTSLTSLSLPSSVTSVGDKAFYGCTSLKSLIVAAEVPPTAGEEIASDYTITLYVHDASADEYKAADEWKKFTLGSIETSVEENAEADGLVVTASNGTIECNAESFTILNLIGQDVTAENGSLQGVYIVRAGENVVKVSVK